jgi:hypothetical protein
MFNEKGVQVRDGEDTLPMFFRSHSQPTAYRHSSQGHQAITKHFQHMDVSEVNEVKPGISELSEGMKEDQSQQESMKTSTEDGEFINNPGPVSICGAGDLVRQDEVMGDETGSDGANPLANICGVGDLAGQGQVM